MTISTEKVILKEKIWNFIYRHFPNIASKYFNPGNFNKVKLKNLLPKNPVILEIGASIGIETLVFRALFPNAIIHSFEPAPGNFRALINRTKGKNIHCHNIGLGKNGKANLMISSGGNYQDSSSFKKPSERFVKDHSHIKHSEIVEVDVQRPEDWCNQNHIKKIDFLWIDVEGSEKDVLENFGEILKSVKVIHIEVLKDEHFEDAFIGDELIDLVKSYGFKIYEEFSTDMVFINNEMN